jgi:hypothetical protein
MAARTKQAKVTVNDAELQEDETPEEPADAEVLGALTEIEGAEEVRWQVYRVSPADKAGYCCAYTSADLKLDRICEDLGPGKYRIRGFNGGKFAGGKTITIAGVPKASTAVVVAPKEDGTLASIITATQNSTSQMMQLMINQSNENNKMLLGVMQAMAANKPPANDMKDTVALIVGLTTAFKPEKSDSQVDTLLKGIKLARELGGGDGDKDESMLSLIGKGIDLARPMLEEAQNARRNNPALPALPAPTVRQVPIQSNAAASMQQHTNAGSSIPAKDGTPAGAVHTEASTGASTKTPDNGEPMLDLMIWLRQQLAGLVRQARKDSDPALYAAVLMDNLPEFLTDDLLRSRLMAENWLEQLAMLNSEVQNYAQWFGEFRDACIVILDTPAETDDDDDKQGTGGGNGGELRTGAPEREAGPEDEANTGGNDVGSDTDV